LPKQVKNLDDALALYDRQSQRENVNKAEKKRQRILELFPLDEWPTMPLERYALGLSDSKNTFCWWMEFGSIELGSMRGGSSSKHIIYKHKEKPGWFFPPNYKDQNDAWERVRAAFVQAFEKAKLSDWNGIDEIESLVSGSALKCKAVHTYYSQGLLPVYSRDDLKHFLRLLGKDGAESKSYEVIRLNRALLTAVRARPEFDTWTNVEIMRFLYDWANPREMSQVVKIAPGHDAKYWDECLHGNYVCVGWDEVGDLREFESKDSFRDRFAQEYGEMYNHHKATISRKANELWTLISLEPGDVVVANKGISKILAVGDVAEPGYEWNADREQFRHTVHVDWDTSYEKQIPPQKSWAVKTVANVPSTLVETIMSKTKPGAVIELTASDWPKVPVEPLYFELANALERKGQVILYGPPGTGKTYHARRFAVWWLLREADGDRALKVLGDQETFARAERELSTVQGARKIWWVVANPKEWNWDQLFVDGKVEYRYGRLRRNYPLVQAGDLVVGYQSSPDKRIVALARVSHGLESKDGSDPVIELTPIAKVSDGLTFADLQSDKILAVSEPLRFNNQGTLFALTMDEADHLFALLAERDSTFQIPAEANSSGIGALTYLTFHPSYSYEDFIEGFRPVEAGTGTLSLRLEDGVFKRVCHEAQANSKKKFLILIDEINRANLSKVFGEIVTLLEKDKRGIIVTLPQSRESFAVPPNVFVLGAMNTADRSIRLLDAALRRRFAFHELMPDSELLSGVSVGSLLLDEFLDELNLRVAKIEGREKQIGHSFLMENGEPLADPEEFARRFRQEILPLLQEYCYDDYSALASYVGEKLVDRENKTLNHESLGDADSLIAALTEEFNHGEPSELS
jgi:5-methylcytosine-specific restriction protein B